MDIEAKLAELGLHLPPAPPPGGNYRPLVVVGNIAYASGHGPYCDDGTYIQGKVGDELSLEEGVKAAQQVALTMLAMLKAQLGDLNQIAEFIKVLGMVWATSDFSKQPLVINGFSDLMVELYGENGRAARSAVGLGSLPGNIPVEIEAIIRLKE